MNSLKRVSSLRATDANQLAMIIARPVSSRHSSISSGGRSNNAYRGLAQISQNYHMRRKSLRTALMTTLEALQAKGAGAGMLEQPSFRRNHGVLLEPPSSWSPTSGCPTIDVRLDGYDMAFVPTLSLIWSALPRKSRRASEALPVTSRQVRSRIGFGSSSIN